MGQLPRRLSSIRQGRFVNHLAFGRALRRFLNSKEPLSLLPDCGWLDGGCLILREALIRWSAGALHPGASVRQRGSLAYVDHGFAWLDIAGRRVLLDGDGVQDEAGLRLKLAELEGVCPSEVHYSTDREFIVGIPRDTVASDRLSQLLSHRFGTFSLELFTQ